MKLTINIRNDVLEILDKTSQEEFRDIEQQINKILYEQTVVKKRMMELQKACDDSFLRAMSKKYEKSE